MMNTLFVIIACYSAASAIAPSVRGFVIVRLKGFSDSSPISGQVVGGGALFSGAMIAGSSIASIGQSNELWVVVFSLLAATIGSAQLVTLRLRTGRVDGAGAEVTRDIKSISYAEIFVSVVGLLAAAANAVS
jgi:flagellar motor component MotA